MKNKYWFIVIVVMLSSLYLIRADFAKLKIHDAMTDDEFRFDWYALPDDEIQRCSIAKTDGYEHQPKIVTGDSFTDVYALSISVTPLTSSQENGTLYEVGWYIQPLNNDITYELMVIDNQSVTTSITEGQRVAQQTTGDADYWAEISQKTYDKVILKIEGQQPREYTFKNK